MIGVSFKRYLTGEVQPPRSRYGVELHNQAAWIDGDWKLRRLVKTFPQAATRRGSCSICTTTRWRPMMSPHNIPSGAKP
jgi:arylsulfatase